MCPARKSILRVSLDGSMPQRRWHCLPMGGRSCLGIGQEVERAWPICGAPTGRMQSDWEKVCPGIFARWKARAGRIQDG